MKKDENEASCWKGKQRMRNSRNARAQAALWRQFKSAFFEKCIKTLLWFWGIWGERRRRRSSWKFSKILLRISNNFLLYFSLFDFFKSKFFQMIYLIKKTQWFTHNSIEKIILFIFDIDKIPDRQSTSRSFDHGGPLGGEIRRRLCDEWAAQTGDYSMRQGAKRP